MVDIREEVEHEIQWKLKEENSSFWFDNWTKLGELYYVEEQEVGEVEMEV